MGAAKTALPKILGILSPKLNAFPGISPDVDIVALARPRASLNDLSDYIHDLKSCARSVKLIIEMIEGGDHFDSSDSQMMLTQVKDATETLKPAIAFLNEIHSSTDHPAS